MIFLIFYVEDAEDVSLLYKIQAVGVLLDDWIHENLPCNPLHFTLRFRQRQRIAEPDLEILPLAYILHVLILHLS